MVTEKQIRDHMDDDPECDDPEFNRQWAKLQFTVSQIPDIDLSDDDMWDRLFDLCMDHGFDTIITVLDRSGFDGLAQYE